LIEKCSFFVSCQFNAKSGAIDRWIAIDLLATPVVGECSLHLSYLLQSSILFGVGTAFPHLFLALHPCAPLIRFVVSQHKTRIFDKITGFIALLVLFSTA